MNQYVAYLKRANGTQGRWEFSEASDKAAREHADVIIRARSSYGEVLELANVYRMDFVDVTTPRTQAS